MPRVKSVRKITKRSKRSYGVSTRPIATSLTRATRIAGMYGGMVYKFKRTCTTGLALNTSTGFNASSTFGLGWGFSLANLLNSSTVFLANTPIPGAANFTDLFDQWRITKVVMKFVWTSTMSNSSTFAAPIFLFQPDDDNFATPTRNEMLESPKTIVCQLGAGGDDCIKEITIYPKVSGSVYQGAFGAFAEVPRSTWMDCAYPDIQYNGLKMFWDNQITGANAVGNLQIYCDFYYEFKGPQ